MKRITRKSVMDECISTLHSSVKVHNTLPVTAISTQKFDASNKAEQLDEGIDNSMSKNELRNEAKKKIKRKAMKKIAREEVMKECNNTLRCKIKVHNTLPTPAISTQWFDDPNKAEQVKDSIDNSMSKNKLRNEEVGIIKLEHIIKDCSPFVRLYQTFATINAFLCLTHKASLRLIAMIVDTLTDNEENLITFDPALFDMYNLTYQTFNKAVKDLMLCDILTKKLGKKSYTYKVNPDIFRCGKVSENDYISETCRKFNAIVLNKEAMSKYGIRKDYVEDIAHQIFGASQKKGQIGIYRSGETDSRSFFKLFRGKFSKSLLSLKHLSSAKIIAYILGNYNYQDRDTAKLNREEVCTAVGISKSTFYRAINDHIEAGTLYRDTKTCNYYLYPTKWHNGSLKKIVNSNCKTKQERRKLKVQSIYSERIRKEILR